MNLFICISNSSVHLLVCKLVSDSVTLTGILGGEYYREKYALFKVYLLKVLITHIHVDFTVWRLCVNPYG